MCCSPLESISKPNFILFNQRKHFFIGYSILMPYNQEFLLIFHKLPYIFTKKRERRICNHYIGFFQQLNALSRTEITGLQY